MKIGTLVKIKGEKDNQIIGWYETTNDIKLRLFDASCLYGIFLGSPINSNNKLWYKVLIEDKVYLFLLTDLEEVKF